MIMIHHGQLGIMNVTTEVYRTWLEHPLLTGIKNANKWCYGAKTLSEVYG